MQPHTCPVCEGTGKHKRKECRPCRGEGIVWAPKDTEQVKLVPYPVPYPTYPTYPTPWVSPYQPWKFPKITWATKTTSSSANLLNEMNQLDGIAVDVTYKGTD